LLSIQERDKVWYFPNAERRPNVPTVCPHSNLHACSETSILLNQRWHIARIAVLTCILFSGLTASAQSGGRIGPSGAAVAGAGIGVGAAVVIVAVVAVSHSHHTLTGCSFNGPNGLKLKTSDSTYSMEGDAANIKAGEKIKVHGSKVKKAKAAGEDQTFRVDKVSKDYGACRVDLVASSPSTPR
jgi:hypothetical protein